jgi:hypothetical protein
MPVPTLGAIAVFDSPNGYMRCAGTDFVIATRTTVGLERSGPGNVSHLVVVTVRPVFDATEHQNSRNSSLSIPRIES